MSPSRVLNVSRVHGLQERNFNQLLVNIPLPNQVEARALLTGEYKPGSVTGSVFQKGRIGDLVRTGRAAIELASARFVEVLQAVSVSRCTTIPGGIVDSELDGKLSVLVVTVTCGPLSYRGEFKEERSLDPPATGWDGSDLFVPENYNGICVTGDAAAYLRKVRLRNLELMPDRLKSLRAS